MTTKTRRWIAVGAFGLLFFIATLTWIAYRPLTDVENRMVGTWRNTTNPGVFTFHADRTMTGRGFPPGAWYCQGNTLYTPDSFIAETFRTLLRQNIDTSSELTFQDDNTVSVFTSINGGTCKWQRVSEP